MAALVLMGQDLPANSSTRPAAAFSSPNTPGPGTARPGSTNPAPGPSDDPANDAYRSPGFDGVVVAGPPLPQAIVLIKVPVLGLLDPTEESGELVAPSGGPVPLEIAGELLAGSSTFLRVLTDPVTGEILPVSPDRCMLREAEREVLRAMVGRRYCPNCMNPILDTEFDHLFPFESGGKSTVENVFPACKKHHGLKHFKDDKARHGVYRRLK